MQLLNVENLIFLLPLLTGILLVFLMAMGVGPDHHVHADFSHDLGHGVGHGVGHAHAGDHGHAVHAPGLVGSFLAFFGIGRVPLAVTIVSACLIWGVLGLAANAGEWFSGRWTAVILAGVGAGLGVRWLSLGLGALLPSVETYAVDTRELVAQQAEVVHEITAAGGTARLTDKEGNLRDLACRLGPDQPPIPRGASVLLFEYDEQAGTFGVRPVRAI